MSRRIPLIQNFFELFFNFRVCGKNKYIIFEKDTSHNNMELLFIAPKKPTTDLYKTKTVIEDNTVTEKNSKEKKAPKS